MQLSHAQSEKRPSFLLALLVCTVITIAMIIFRLHILHHRYVPLADSLPLLICLWARYRRLLWGMAIVLTVVCLIKLVFVNDAATSEDNGYIGLSAVAMMATIWLTAGVLHVLLNTLERLEHKNDSLQQANAELEAANEELITRDDEIQRQNEELQSQTEELEQQTAELERQSTDLQDLNDQLAQREKGLEALLDSGRWLRTDLDQHAVIARICDIALQILEGDAHAVSIVQKRGDRLMLRGCAGLGAAGPSRQSWPYEKSFGAVIMEQKRTGFVPDISICPDVEVLQPSQGAQFQSLLATPLTIGGETSGAVVVYSRSPRQWNEKTFKVVEWLAAQIALVIEALDLHVELLQRRRQAEHESQRKTRFLAAVSHDVRTPANAINLMAELISRAARTETPTAEIADMARDLQSSARLLVELVSDVLDLARFDSAELDLQTDEFDLWPAIHAEIKQLLPLAREQNLRLAAHLPDTPLWLRTDRMKLARVLGNLVGNAIKFTEAGGVEVRAGELPDRSVEIQIIDTGVGIDPDHLNAIFDEFFQLRNPARDRSRGTGLGLAICKRLVAAIGCTLTVTSTPGQGSTFKLKIPASLRIATPSPAPGPTLETDGDGRLSGLRILLVEDHEMTRRATARVFAAEGATVIQADHGRAALQMLAHDFPQVLLLDLMLPDIDGAEVLRALENYRPASLKVILVVSGDVTGSRVEQVKALGAQALIAKPVDIESLIKTIQSAMPMPAPAITRQTQSDPAD